MLSLLIKLGTRYLLHGDDYQVPDCVYDRGPYLGVIPADPDLEELEQHLLLSPEGRLRLRTKLAPLNFSEFVDGFKLGRVDEFLIPG